MDNNFGVDDSAGKLQTLEKIKNLIENGQSESFQGATTRLKRLLYQLSSS